MKKHIYRLLLITLITSCTKALDPISHEDKYCFKLDINRTGYEATKSDYQWPDGAKLYIQFYNKENTLNYPATATYSSSTNGWTISSPQGELNVGDSTLCTVVYIPDKTYSDVIELNTGNALYEDSNAKYYLDGNTLTVKANLTPKTGRLRFAGNTGETIKLYGISHYITYNPHYNFFGSSDSELELTVQDNGYTPYIHVYFPNEAKRLEVTKSDGKIFIFKCSSKHLEPGISGYFNIPTEAEHGNWKIYENTRTFQIEGTDLSIKMIFVQWIEGSYYMAETETTQELWKAITNENPSYHKSDLPGLPVENFNDSKLKEFLASLQDKVGYPFTIPTFEQWLHAAKGGNKTKGYKYSGSDNLDEVAWYNDNSNNTTNLVKKKKANELGLYDMSGNVSECCAYYYSYSSGYYILAHGGNFQDSYRAEELDLNETHKENSYNSRYYVGFRLCLNL